MQKFSNEKLVELENQALTECCSETTTAHHGGKDGRPFWNSKATQFMFVPAFDFSRIPGCTEYLFKAVDKNGNEHLFTASQPNALLTPVWKDIPEGVVRLYVTALNENGDKDYPVGARTFFKLSPFRADYPKAECSYRKAFDRAFDYVMHQKFVLHWLNEGVPDPSYDLNVYPCKMISSLIKVMMSYARVCPENKATAVRIAGNAANYLLSLVPGEESALPWLPPTYSFRYCKTPEKYGFDHNGNWRQAHIHGQTTMLIYPALAGEAFLIMEKETGEQKYLEEALKIGEFFFNNVEENGSWKITWSETTGKPVTDNYADPLRQICPFLMGLYLRTRDEKWKNLADGAIRYVEKTVLPSYNWEGQFEDSVLSSNYSNLTHFGAASLAEHYALFYSGNEERMKVAEDLMRFVEDQFVVWNMAPPWYDTKREYDPKLWHTPGVLEQYNWYTPIDSSAAIVAEAFLAMYKAGRGDLYLAKAICLADQLVVMQNSDGQIPTHWSDCEGARKDMWFNCMFASMKTLGDMAGIIQ